MAYQFIAATGFDLLRGRSGNFSTSGTQITSFLDHHRRAPHPDKDWPPGHTVKHPVDRAGGHARLAGAVLVAGMPHQEISDRLLGFRQSLLNILDDVVYVFYTHAQPHHTGSNPSRGLLCLRQLAVRGRSGMTGKRLGITDIHQALEQ